MFIYDDEDSGNVLCVCNRIVHFRGSLALIYGLCDYVFKCICAILAEFISLCPYIV